MTSPSAALSRTLSLQRANARAKSTSKAESLSGQVQSQLSKRIDLLFTSNHGLTRRKATDLQSSTPLDEPSKQLPNLLPVEDSNPMKKCFSADVYKACFANCSEQGVDLWDHDFSSMSSYASEHDGFLCGLRSRLNSDSSVLCESAKGVKEDACSKSSWSEDSFVDAIQGNDGVSSIAFRFEGLDVGCTSESPPYRLACQSAQCGLGGSLRVPEKHNVLMPECHANNERAKIDYKARGARGLEEYLMRRGACSVQCLQVGASGTDRSHDAFASDGDENTRVAMAKRQEQLSTNGGSSTSEKGGEGEVILTSCEKDGNKDDRWRVRCKTDYDRLEESLESTCERDEEEEEEEQEEEEENVGMNGLRTLSADSVAVEMMSVNVVEDFRESMYEMMLEKNMEEECEESSMQDLLNCYLLLNPSPLHDIIRQVFSDVWIDIIMNLR